MTARRLEFPHNGVNWVATIDPDKFVTTADSPDVPLRWVLEYGGSKEFTGPAYFEDEPEAVTIARMRDAIDGQWSPQCGKKPTNDKTGLGPSRGPLGRRRASGKG